MPEVPKSLNVFFLTTYHEFANGHVKEACDSYLALDPSPNGHKFHLLFIFNTGDESIYESLLSYQSHPCVKKVTIKSLKIPPEDDVYDKEVTLFKFEEKGAPWLGLSMGPNLLFFMAMDYLATQEESHSLLLETDSYPIREGWFDRCHQFMRRNKFTIAGSHYKGKYHIPDEMEWKWHLNGIAIYRHSSFLKGLLRDAKADIIRRISSGDFYQWNFDVAICTALQLPKYKNDTERNNRCMNVDFIVNMSLEVDDNTTDKEVHLQYPSCHILHKKR